MKHRLGYNTGPGTPFVEPGAFDHSRPNTPDAPLAQGERQCEKCGSKDIHTRYRGPGEQLDAGIGTDRSYFERVETECLRHYCRGCTYRWSSPALALYASAAPEGVREAWDALMQTDEPTDHSYGSFAAGYRAALLARGESAPGEREWEVPHD